MGAIDDLINRRFAPSLTADRPRADGAGWESDGRWGTKLRWLIFPAVFLSYLGATAAGVAQYSRGAGRIVGFVLVGVFCVVYLTTLQISRSHPEATPRSTVVGLVTLIAICAAEVPFAHQDAFVMLVFVLVLSISRVGARAAPLVVVAVVVSTFVPAMVGSWHHGVDTDLGISMLVTSLAMWAFFGVIRVNRELGCARAEVAQLAAENERSRIARDLHDLLGHSLTAVTIKAGLARRLLDSDPTRAATEIAEVEDLARRSLADVRAAVSGYREVTLVGELASGRELLRAAGVDADFPTAVEIDRSEHHELFGWVVREGLTNVVRHAHATRCEVRVGPTWVEVVDDGCNATTAAATGDGNGLRGLTARVDAAGAAMAAGPRDGGGWSLRVDAERASTAS